MVAGHGRVADREDEQEQTDDDVGKRKALAVAEEHRHGRPAGHRRQWRGRRDDEEGDTDDAEAAPAQLMGVRRIDDRRDGYGVGHLGSVLVQADASSRPFGRTFGHERSGVQGIER